MQALSAQLRECFILGYEFHRATAHAAMRCHRANHDRTQNRLTMSIDVAFVTGFLCKETRNIQLGAYMQASGAVSRVRQARTMRASSDERGCPHESRRGHAFCTTCGGSASEHEGSR